MTKRKRGNYTNEFKEEAVSVDSENESVNSNDLLSLMELVGYSMKFK